MNDQRAARQRLPFDATAVIRTETDRFARILAGTAPEAHCPTCPEWNAADLLWHLVEVHSFWARILQDNPQTGPEVQAIEESPPGRPADTAAMVPLLSDATDAMLQQLSELADEEARWSWWDADQTVGFTRHMQVCEATMHRVDAELTAGQPISPIPAEVAAAAVDQCADVMWGWMPDWAEYEVRAVAELLASDTDQRWLVEVGHWFGTGPQSGTEFDEIRAVRAAPDAQPTATVTGTTQDLALWAWTRGGDVVLDGAPESVAAVKELIARGIQ